MVETFNHILDAICDPLTVTSFSKKCEITQEEAITILQKYVKSKGEPVWSLYEVSGTVAASEFSCLIDNVKMHKHVVVPEAQLEEVKSKFEVVTSTRLHSVQRTNPKDTRVYGRQWASNDDLQGKIVPKQGEKTKQNAMEVTRKKSASPEPKTVIQSSTTEPTKKTIIPPKKQTSVASMFAKRETKVAGKVTEKSPSPPPQKESSSRKRPKIEVDEPEQKEPIRKVTESIFNKFDDEFPSSREQTPEKSSPPPKKSKKVNDENKKVRTTNKKELIAPEESDDDEKMDVDQNTPKSVKREKSTTPGETERRRTTRIEKVTETYVDEDGYLVSKEVKKAVECTPSPEKPKTKPRIDAPIPGTSKPGKKTATITSFFKKA